MDLDDYEIPINPKELLYRAIQLDDLVCFQSLESEIDSEVLKSLDIKPNTKIYEYLGYHLGDASDSDFSDADIGDVEDDFQPDTKCSKPLKTHVYAQESKIERYREYRDKNYSDIQHYKDRSKCVSQNMQHELYIKALKELKSINRKREKDGLPPLDKSIIEEPETFKK